MEKEQILSNEQDKEPHEKLFKILLDKDEVTWQTIIHELIKTLRKKGVLPAVLYGPKVKNQVIEVDSRAFEKVYKEALE